MVVADHPRRIQRLFKIAGFKQTINRPRPDARQAIGLQFKTHRQSVRLRLAHHLPAFIDLPRMPNSFCDMTRTS